MFREYRHHNVKREYDKNEITDFSGPESVENLSINKNYMSKIFNLSWADVRGAVVATVLVAIIGFILQAGNIWIVDWHAAINVGVMAGLGRLLEALVTTEEGKVAGIVKVK